MIEQITKGIKIAVKPSYEGAFYKDRMLRFAFSYHITIENNSLETVQLKARHWDIFDALNFKQVVDGEGVIGEQPILHPNDTHKYESGCVLTAPIGAMQGYYNMENLITNQQFKVYVPLFKLIAPLAQN